MVAAVIGFLGVVVGAAVAGGISLLQVQLVTRREREARQIEREEQRKDARDAFQRETLLGLQDAVSDQVLLIVRRTAVSPDWKETDQRLVRLGARVFDKELGPVVRQFRMVTFDAAEAQNRGNEEQLRELIPVMGELSRKIHGRINELLPDLF